MIAKINSAGLVGLDPYLVEVEVDVSPGLPSFLIVGLGDAAVQEARERVRSAIKNSQFEFPTRRITVNLAPALIKKEGSLFDLPMALGVLVAGGQILPVRAQSFHDLLAVGELSLDGTVRPVTGVLPLLSGILELGVRRVILPRENAEEGMLVRGLSLFPVSSLREAARILTDGDPTGGASGGILVSGVVPEIPFQEEYDVDFQEVKGQEHIKRALEVAAAGGHNLLMIGPPGSGKTMLARRFPTILPPMSQEESLEVTKIYSLCGMLPARRGASSGGGQMPGHLLSSTLTRQGCVPLVTSRPFRSPHHSLSFAGLVGGSKAGELSLAHEGILFLDEFPEFHRDVLQALRQPLEEGKVHISRAGMTVTYPASFILLAAMNPCACGYFGDPVKECACTPLQISRYLRKVSGPLFDRFDIHVEVPRLPPQTLTGNQEPEPSSRIRERVIQAREVQRGRFPGKKRQVNAALRPRETKAHCSLSSQVKDLVTSAIEKLHLSPRAYEKILKVARTIADLERSSTINPPHVAEAIQYRSLDRKYWG